MINIFLQKRLKELKRTLPHLIIKYHIGKRNDTLTYIYIYISKDDFPTDKRILLFMKKLETDVFENFNNYSIHFVDKNYISQNLKDRIFKDVD